jgi:hypothetical protein
MKPRARRITIAAALLGLAVVAVLVIAHLDTVRDHIEAWRVQRSSKMQTITPGILRKVSADDGDLISLAELAELVRLLKADGSTEFHASSRELFCLLADGSGLPVIFDPIYASDSSIYRVLTEDLEVPQVADTLRILEENGFRVLEQFLPIRAYVVVGEEARSEASEWDGEEPAMNFAGVDQEPALEVQAETVEEEADDEAPQPVIHPDRLRRTK